MTKSAQYQFLIYVDGWPGYFVQRTGGDNQGNVQAVYDGGALIPDLVGGRPRPTNVVVQRHFDRDRDAQIVHDYALRVLRWRTTISITPTDENMIPTGPKRVYPLALLARVSEPGANAQSDDPSTWEAEFAVAQMA